MAEPMPRLSDLPGPVAPDRCQWCGAHDWAGPHLRFRECDERDEPTDVIVVLCRRCSGKPLTVHPRLYRELDHQQHWPGAMAPLCVDCRHRDGTRCVMAKRYGGPGVEVAPGPSRMHLRPGGLMLFWPEPQSCSRREVLVIFNGEG